MRITGIIILLIITLAGTFYPCCINDGCSSEEKSLTDHKTEKQPEGNCSPFFSCASCSGFTHAVKTISLKVPERHINIEHPITQEVIISSYISSFWQPPRFC